MGLKIFINFNLYYCSETYEKWKYCSRDNRGYENKFIVFHIAEMKLIFINYPLFL